MTTQGEYRGDIDGLRAVSVLAVVAFHYGLIPGGYIGVDVFFVISGYLITRIIAHELSAGKFTFAHFWDRRVRRIWPASLVVTAATLAAGWVILLPEDYRVLSADAIASVAMLSNFRYSRGAEYFADSSELRPLLNTWSLSVEEQFYAVIPILLVLAWRIWLRQSPQRSRLNARLAMTLGGIAIASFAYSVIRLPEHQEEVFYMLPARAWELLIGALAALIPLNCADRRLIREPLCLAGLATIVYCAVAYSDTTPFPGATALLPCLGALAVIVTGSHGSTTWATALLATRPLTSIGLMSYSIYLWHWPILVFTRYLGGTVLSPSALCTAAVLTIALAYVSWRFVEQPFRRASRAHELARRTAGLAVAAAMGVGLPSLAIWWLRGVPERFKPETLRLVHTGPVADLRWAFTPKRVASNDPSVFRPIGTMPTEGDAVPDGEACVLFLGDSHGMAISPALDHSLRQCDLAGYAALRIGSPPMPGIWMPSALADVQQEPELSAWLAAQTQGVKSLRPRHVILCARWSAYLSGDWMVAEKGRRTSGNPDHAQVAASRAMERLADLCDDVGAELWVLLEVPYQSTPQRLHALHTEWVTPTSVVEGVTLSEHKRYTQHVARWVQQPWSSRAHILDLADGCFHNGLSLVAT